MLADEASTRPTRSFVRFERSSLLGVMPWNFPFGRCSVARRRSWRQRRPEKPPRTSRSARRHREVSHGGSRPASSRPAVRVAVNALLDDDACGGRVTRAAASAAPSPAARAVASSPRCSSSLAATLSSSCRSLTWTRRLDSGDGAHDQHERRHRPAFSSTRVYDSRARFVTAMRRLRIGVRSTRDAVARWQPSSSANPDAHVLTSFEMGARELMAATGSIVRRLLRADGTHGYSAPSPRTEELSGPAPAVQFRDAKAAIRLRTTRRSARASVWTGDEAA